jgi:hypothetical protein
MQKFYIKMKTRHLNFLTFSLGCLESNKAFGTLSILIFFFNFNLCKGQTFGNAFRFDGNNDHLQVISNTNFDLVSSTNFTIELWVKLHGNHPNFHGLLAKGTGTPYYQLAIHNNRFTVEMAAGTSIFYRQVNQDLNDGKWHHLACVFRRTPTNNVLLYIDGTLRSSENASILGSTLTNNINFIIGTERTKVYYLNGSIDEIRIWNIERSATEIANNQNVLIADNSPNLLGVFRFEQGIANSDNSFLKDTIQYQGIQAGTAKFFNATLFGSTSNFIPSYAGIKPNIVSTLKACNNEVLLLANTPITDGNQGLKVQYSEDSTFNHSTSILIFPIDTLIRLNNLKANTRYYARALTYQTNRLDSSNYSNTFTFLTNNAISTITSLPQTLYIGNSYSISNPNNLTFLPVGKLNIHSASSTIEAISDGTVTITQTLEQDGCTNVYHQRHILAYTPGKALLINHSQNNSVEITNHNNFNFGSGQNFTIECWFRTTDTRTGFEGLVTKGASTGNFYQLAIYQNKIFAELRTSTYLSCSGNILVKDGKWHHAALVVNKSSNIILLYLDGKLEASAASSNAITQSHTNTSPLRIGVDRENLNYYNGLIDEVRIWSEARTLSQLTSLMKDTVAPNTSNLIACYRFDEGVGNISDTVTSWVQDIGLNQHHGRLMNYNIKNGSPWMQSLAMVNIKNLTSSAVCNGQFTLNWENNKHGKGLNIIAEASIIRNSSTYITNFTQTLLSNNSPISLNYSESNPIMYVRLKYLSTENTGESISSDTILISNLSSGEIGGNTNIELGQNSQYVHDSAGGTWASSNPSIATINSTGMITTIAPGRTTISYTYTRGTCTYIANKNINIKHPHGNALAFLSSAKTYITGNLNTLPTGNQARTISFYLKPNTSFSNGTCISYGTSNLNKDFFNIGLQGKKVRVQGNSFTLISKNTVLDNHWNHVAVTTTLGSPSIVSIFINFILDTTFSVNINTQGSSFILGSNLTLENAEFISGELDEVKIWNKNLVLEEINISRLSDTILQSFLVAHYTFDQGYALQNNLLDTITINKGFSTGNGVLRNFRLQDSITNYTLSYALPAAYIVGANQICFQNGLINIGSNLLNYMTDLKLEISSVRDFSLSSEINNVQINSLLNQVALTNLNPNTTYYVRIRPINNVLNIMSSPSKVYSFTTLNGPTNISTPVQIYKGQIVNLGSNGFSGQWHISNTTIGTINSSNGQYIASDSGSQVIGFTYVETGCSAIIEKNLYIQHVPGTAFHFNGTSSSLLQAPHHAGINMGTGSLTVELWFQTSNSSSAFMGMISKGAFGSYYQIAKYQNKLVCEIRTSSGSYFMLQSSALINDGKWHHAALTIVRGSPNTANLFLDGNLVQTISNASLSQTIDNEIPLKIGVEREGNIRFIGKLDEIRIWNLARTTVQIRQFMFDTVSVNENNLVAYYRFDDGIPERNNASNRVLRDFSMTQNHANFNANFAMNGSSDNYVMSMAMLSQQQCINLPSCGNQLKVSFQSPKFGFADSSIFEIVSDTNNLSSFVSSISGSRRRLADTIEINNLNRNQLYYWRARPFNSIHGEIASTQWNAISTITCLSTWTGNQNSNWENPMNWHDLNVPRNNSVIRIPNTTYKPSLNSKVTIDSLILEHSAILSLSTNPNDTLTINLGVSGTGLLKGNEHATLQLLSSRSNYQILFIQTTNEFENSLKNLIINNVSRTITLGNQLNLRNRLNLIAGTLQCNTGNLVLKADANGSGVIGNYSSGSASIIGMVQLEIFVPGRRAFRFISHPFSNNISFNQVKNSIFITGNGGSTNGFDPTTSNNPSLFSYNPMVGNIASAIDPGWQAITNLNTQMFEPNKGYRILVRGSRSQTGTLAGSNETPKDTIIRLIGSINDGISKTIVLAMGSNSKFNLIGNPFAGPIDLSLVTFTNCKPNIFFFDPWRGTKGGFYASERILPNIIPAGSAFFVEQNNAGAASITFPPNAKQLGTSVKQLHKNKKENLHIQIVTEDSTIWDEFSLVSSNLNSNNFEDEDARKLMNPEINLFSKSFEKIPLSIDVRNLESLNLPIYLTSTTKGDFILDFSKSNLPKGKTYWLNYNNTSTEIRQDLKYQLRIENRTDTIEPIFYISTDKVTAISDYNSKSKIKAPYPNPFKTDLNIDEQLLNLGLNEIYITDITGRIIKRFDPNKLENKLKVDELPNGIYILNINYVAGNASFKLIKN